MVGRGGERRKGGGEPSGSEVSFLGDEESLETHQIPPFPHLLTVPFTLEALFGSLPREMTTGRSTRRALCEREADVW